MAFSIFAIAPVESEGFQYISMGHILKTKIPQQKVIFDIVVGLEFVENHFLLRYFDL